MAELHPDAVRAYHAHVYYEPATSPAAAGLRARPGELYPVQLGRWHDVPVGPHSRGMYQVLFMPDAFAAVLSWPMLNRRGLDVLLHPETGDEVADHTAHALWLGNRLPLRCEALQAH